MRAGKLRHRVTIQAPVAATDEYGGQVSTWTNFATNVAASIEPLSGREMLAAQAVQNETTHKVGMRYLPGVTSAMRIVFGSRTFGIINVLNREERDRELQILCTEGVNNG